MGTLHAIPSWGLGATLSSDTCAITCFCSAQDERHEQKKQRFCPVSEKREGQAEADRHRGQAAPQPDQQPSLVRGLGTSCPRRSLHRSLPHAWTWDSCSERIYVFFYSPV